MTTERTLRVMTSKGMLIVCPVPATSSFDQAAGQCFQAVPLHVNTCWQFRHSLFDVSTAARVCTLRARIIWLRNAFLLAYSRPHSSSPLLALRAVHLVAQTGGGAAAPSLAARTSRTPSKYNCSLTSSVSSLPIVMLSPSHNALPILPETPQAHRTSSKNL
eukprot:4368758-Pyramimonas_sp.AAC.1